MSYLDTILAHKKLEVQQLRRRFSRKSFDSFELMSRKPLSLSPALEVKRPSIIAEIKKASPSRGLIRSDYDPAVIATQYQSAGAAAVSVLTDEKFFLGSLDHLRIARTHLAIPILRKDFIIDALQLAEAKAHGADAVLLIIAALAREQLRELQQEAASLGLECLIEVHDPHELDALDWPSTRILGVNNRNLKTFQVDVKTTEDILPLVPENVLVVSESGLGEPATMRQLHEKGVDAFLIGEAFMSAAHPGEALQTVLEALHQ